MLAVTFRLLPVKVGYAVKRRAVRHGPCAEAKACKNFERAFCMAGNEYCYGSHQPQLGWDLCQDLERQRRHENSGLQMIVMDINVIFEHLKPKHCVETIDWSVTRVPQTPHTITTTSLTELLANVDLIQMDVNVQCFSLAKLSDHAIF